MLFDASALTTYLLVVAATIDAATAGSSKYQLQNDLHTAASGSWHQYVRSPPTNIVHPVAIVSSLTTGNVTNPNGLLHPGHGPTILSRNHAPDGKESERPTIVIDFGQNIVGYLSVSFAGASNNTPGVQLAFSETLEYLTDKCDFTRGYNGDTITPGTDQYAVPSEPVTWTNDHGCLYGTKVCSDGLHGFRYLKIYLDALESDAPHTSAYGEVSIESVSLNFTAFLGTPDTFTGWFESSDNELNQWWYDAVYTNDMCIDTFGVNDTEPRSAASPSLIGKLVIHDGAKRDRDPYVGDLAVSGRTAYLTHDISEAARNVLADLADHQRADGWIPPASIMDYTLPLLDYPLWWVVCSYDLFMYTGDVAYIRKYYKSIIRVLDDFYPSVTDPSTGLITKGIGVSGGYGDYAFLPRSGPVTYYNALYVLALDNAASIATFLGEYKDDVARWTSRAKNVSIAINTHLFDTSVGAFYDSTTGRDGLLSHAQDGNSLSIISGVANHARAVSSLAYLSANNARPYGNVFFDNDALNPGYSQRVYAFMSYFEIEARFMTGLTDSALDEIRRLYGWMSSHDPGVTFWEGIGEGGSLYEGAYSSQAHGWATGIVPALTNFVLGVIPMAPGFKAWSVRPIPGDVTWARGQVPTLYGPISVDWRKATSHSQFQLRISSPVESSGEISVPVPDRSTPVYIDFVLAWDGTRALLNDAVHNDGYITLQVSGGDHTVTVGSSREEL